MTAATPVWRYLAAGALLAALALIIGGSAPAGASTPRLRMLDASPVRLAGSGFSPRERVRVRVRTGGSKRTRRVRANSRGRFRVTFRHLAQDPCRDSLSATAVGSAGHVTSLTKVRRLCPPSTDTPGSSGSGQGTSNPPPADPCLNGDRQCPPSL